MLATAATAFAGSLPEKRELEPVVIPLATLPNWLNSDTYAIDKLNLYKYDGATQTFTAIPFQIDKRRKINLKYNANATGRVGYVDVCEYGYFDVLSPPSGYSSPFTSNQLKARDELVFMIADAGTDPAPVNAWIAGSVATKRYQIALRDLGNDERRYVYLFAFTSTASGLSTTDYVTWWDKDAGGNPCPAQGFACPTDNNCGCAEGNPSGALTGREGVRLRFSKNWVLDVLQVKDSGGSMLADVLDRFQAGTLGGETEDSWSTAGWPRNLGIKDGKVRVIRGIEGAQSGLHTTRYELIYPTGFTTRINLRVHPLGGVYFGFDHDDGLFLEHVSNQPGYLHFKTKYDAGTYLDRISRSYSGPPSFGAESFFDWTEMISQLRGTYVQLLREPRSINSESRSVTYRDTVDLLGNHARNWLQIGDLQDGYLYDDNGNVMLDPYGNPIGNDGGCTSGEDPEGPNYKFGRGEWTFFAQNSSATPSEISVAAGPKFSANQDLPTFFAGQEQTKDLAPLPRPSPCTPGFQVSNPGTGVVNATIGTPCNGGGFDIGYNVYRDDDTTGSLGFYRDIGTATSFTDSAVIPGKTYRYALRAYNDEATLGTATSVASVTVTDTTPPGRPIGIVVQPQSHGGRITWEGSFDRDLKGYNIYISTTGGGSYAKINGAVYGADRPKEWIVTGLSSSQTYYIVMKAVDFSGNESGYSTEVSFTPLP